MEKPNVAVHVAEVGKHLLAMRALMFGDLNKKRNKFAVLIIQRLENRK